MAKRKEASLTFDAFLQHGQVVGHVGLQLVDFKCSRDEKEKTWCHS